MSRFDGKFLKWYFAWISPAPFCTILTQNIKWHKKFLFMVYFILLKIRNCYGLISWNLEKNKKSIKNDNVMLGNMG